MIKKYPLLVAILVIGLAVPAKLAEAVSIGQICQKLGAKSTVQVKKVKVPVTCQLVSKKSKNKVWARIAKPTATTTTQSETRTVAVALIAAISNVESRTVTAANLLKTYTATEKESLLNVTLNSAKSAVVNVSTDIPSIKMVVTATKAGSKPIVFNVKTDTEGDAQIKTSKNLTGFTVTLSANGVKLDSDKAVKK